VTLTLVEARILLKDQGQVLIGQPYIRVASLSLNQIFRLAEAVTTASSLCGTMIRQITTLHNWRFDARVLVHGTFSYIILTRR
jgi:hypothetical protein